MIKKGYILVISVLAIMLVLNECKHNASIGDLKDSYDSVLAFTQQEQNESLDSDSLIVQELILVKQNVIDSKLANELLKKEFEGFKKFQSKVKTEMITEINNLTIEYSPSEKGELDGIELSYGDYIHKDTVIKNFVRIPKKIEMDCTWVSLYGTIGKEFTLDSLSVFNKFDIVLGYKKPDKSFKLFRKSEPVLEFKSYSPYTSVPYINNLTVEDKNRSFLTSKPMITLYALASGYIAGRTLK